MVVKIRLIKTERHRHNFEANAAAEHIARQLQPGKQGKAWHGFAHTSSAASPSRFLKARDGTSFALGGAGLRESVPSEKRRGGGATAPASRLPQIHLVTAATGRDRLCPQLRRPVHSRGVPSSPGPARQQRLATASRLSCPRSAYLSWAAPPPPCPAATDHASGSLTHRGARPSVRQPRGAPACPTETRRRRPLPAHLLAPPERPLRPGLSPLRSCRFV